MDAAQKTTEYLELQEFLLRNPCVKIRTFTRWKKRGLIDFIQPGGPNTAIFVPANALERMEQRAIGQDQLLNNVDKTNTIQRTKSVRKPNWMNRHQPNRKDSNAKKK